MPLYSDTDLIPTETTVRLKSPSEIAQSGPPPGGRPQHTWWPTDGTEQPLLGATLNTLDVLGAAFRQNNTVSSTLGFFDFERNRAKYEPVDGYDPFKDIAGYEDRAKAFQFSQSPGETALIKLRIDAERRDRETLAAAGPGGMVASVAAGIIDPVNLIPIGGWAIKGGRTAQILGRAGEGVVIGSLSATAAEGVLLATQEERTPGESGLNISSAAVFGGVLGTIGGVISREGRMKPAKAPVLGDIGATKVADDVTAKLIALGRPEAEARAAGLLYGEKYAATAKRFNTDAWTEYQRAGVSVRNAPFDEPPFGGPEPGVRPEMPAPPREPGVLGMGDTEVGQLLRELRGRGGVDGRKPMTLLDMISKEGGIVDKGGDLAAMDADLWHTQKPFRNRLLRADTGDEAALRAAPERWAERAWERGYIREPTEEALYGAIRKEMAGDPVRPFDDAGADPARVAARDELEQVLADLGLDATDSPATIRKALLRKQQEDELQAALDDWEADPGRYEQAALPEPLAAFAERIRAQAHLDKFDLHETAAGDLRLDMIAVDKAAQGGGRGTEAMRALVDFADRAGRRIILSPSAADKALGTTSRARLVKFYKRFGFKENTGRGRDLSISDAMVREPVRSGVFNQTAYHGTPHFFDRFTTDRIGTGEGHQAFGWGLYFASEKAVAEHYRKQLAGGPRVKIGDVDAYKFANVANLGTVGDLKKAILAKIDVDWSRLKEIEPDAPAGEPGQAWAWARRAVSEFLTHVELTGNLETAAKDAAKALRAWGDRPLLGGMVDRFKRLDAYGSALIAEQLPKIATLEKPGRLYHVELPHLDEFMSWEKTVADQPPKVRDTLKEAFAKLDQSWVDDILDRKNAELDELTGEEVYQVLRRAHEDDVLPVQEREFTMAIDDKEAASLFLRDNGLPGIAYLDQGSRVGSTGTHNFVVFDDAHVQLTTFEQSGRGVDQPGNGAPDAGREAAPGPAGSTPGRSAVGDGSPSAGGGAGGRPGVAIGDHLDESHARLYALAKHVEAGDLTAGQLRAEAADLARNMAQFMDWTDVPMSAAERKAVRAGYPVSVRQMIEAARDYARLVDEQRAKGHPASAISFYDPDLAADGIRHARGRGDAYGDAPARNGDLFDQRARGQIELGGRRAVISLFQTADASTFFHETGHLWLRDLINDAARRDAPQALKDDLATVLQYLGADSASNITRDQHELFARSFEQYLAEGKAPSPKLAAIFEQFKEWLKAIYRSLADLNAPVNDEIRQVFDRMLSFEDKFDLEWRSANAPDLGGAQWVGDGSLSAAAAGDMSEVEARVAKSFGLAGFEAKNPISDNPLLVALHSPSPEVVRVASQLAETPYFLTGNEVGKASPVAVETRIKGWSAPLAEALQGLDEQFARYRFGRAKKLGDMSRAGLEDVTGQSGGRLTFLGFKEEVAKAMRRGDASTIPEVAEAARWIRSRIVEPLKEAAINAKLLDEGVEVTTAESYLTRVYDLEKISSRRNEFTDLLTDWFEMRGGGEEGLSRAELRGEAEEVVAKILSTAPGRTGYDNVSNLRGPLKERTLTVPDALIEDFLENDVERVLRIYTRTMAADVEMARAFERPDMRGAMDRIRSSYDRLFRRTPDGPEQAALKKRFEADIRAVEGMRDRIRGTYGAPENPMGLAYRVFRTVQTLNYLRLLGLMTVSAIPDVGRTIVAAGGLGRVMQRGLGPMIADLRTFRMAAAEVRRAGTALDIALDTRAASMADVFDDFGRYSKFERGVTHLGEKMGLVSGMSVWNAALKQFSGVMIQSRMLEAIRDLRAGRAIPAGELRQLRFLGIDDDMVERIGAQYDAHGAEHGGTWWANTEAWTDAEAARTYRAALVKEVDRIIVTPGQEKPLWMSRPLGKAIGQFKSFTFASMSKALISGLQQRDAAFVQSFIVSVALGSLSYYLKTHANGREASSNPAKWLVEGLDNSGMLGWFFEANNILEKVTGNRLGVNAAIGEAPSSRYASRSLLDSLGGPTVGAVNDVGKAAWALSGVVFPDKNGERRSLTRSDVHRMRRLVPFQNLWATGWLFNMGEEGLGDAMGIPDRPENMP